MSSEKISILLETVSFFLVTLDLFGKERLNNFYHGFRKTLEGIRAKGLNSIYDFFTGKGLGPLIGLVSITFFMAYIYKNFRTWISENALLGFLVFILSFVIGILLYTLLLVIFFGTLEFILPLTIGNLLKVLNRFKIEGVMLFFGSILFIASKVIAWYY